MKLKKENLTMRLFHPTKGEIDLGSISTKDLNALSKEKGYEHLFETEKPKK